MIGFKLLRQRKDGSLGPLFINRRQRLEIGVEYQAEEHRTKGYAFRPGWHILDNPEAPHLSTKDRVWARVEFTRKETIIRPVNQGGVWYLGSSMKILNLL